MQAVGDLLPESAGALSKLYYVAKVLPLPGEHRRKVESRLSGFIFRGRHERLKLSLVLCPRQCQEVTLYTSTCMIPLSRLLVEGWLGRSMTLSSVMQYCM